MFDKNLRLYRSASGEWTTAGDMLDKLKAVEADQCDILFIQTDIMFGAMNKELKRKDLLQALAEVLLELKVKTIVIPTFTYSFANHEAYDVCNSKTSMGVLLEYMRKMPQAIYRTHDPLLSVAILGKEIDGLKQLPHNSLGKGSAFDQLHQMGNVKFLMFGGQFGESFTYVHHVEKVLEVPYRYDQEFSGEIIDENGHSRAETWSIHTACGGVRPRNFYDFEEELVERKIMKRESVCDGKLVCVSEPDVYREICAKIKNNINYFLECPFSSEDLVKEYKYGKNGERVTHC